MTMFDHIFPYLPSRREPKVMQHLSIDVNSMIICFYTGQEYIKNIKNYISL